MCATLLERAEVVEASMQDTINKFIRYLETPYSVVFMKDEDLSLIYRLIKKELNNRGS